MEIVQNKSLQAYNTFGIAVNTSQFVEIESVEELTTVLRGNKAPLLILGGGSNVLFIQDFNGLVVKNNLRGIEILQEDENEVLLKVGAGEVWHELVLYCIENGYAGLENMSLIPGSVGASPMQNIGAYGAEVKHTIVEVEAFHLIKHKIEVFSNEACEFGYRSSIFKTRQKGNYFITSVTYRLNKKPSINTSYGAIDNQLKEMGIISPTIKNVSDAVIAIRNSKLPNPKEIGNAGSFFKNPVITAEDKDALLLKDPEMPNYAQPDGTFKVAAGWLIEQSGWKGKTIKNCGVHKKQALVLVNYGGAKGNEIYDLSEQIIRSVHQNFAIELEREVNIIK